MVAKIRHSLKEALVVVRALVGTAATEPIEAVYGKLPGERAELGLLEELGHDLG